MILLLYVRGRKKRALYLWGKTCFTLVVTYLFWDRVSIYVFFSNLTQNTYIIYSIRSLKMCLL